MGEIKDEFDMEEKMDHKSTNNVSYYKAFITIISIDFLLSDIIFILNYRFLQDLFMISG